MESVERAATPHESLKLQFLNGEISPEEFLETLYTWDQSEPTRAAALLNVKTLEDPQVADGFINSEYQSEFYDALGFFYFHQAQIYESREIPGINDFKKALTCSQLSGVIDEPTVDWQRYVGATIAYLQNDLFTLRSLHNENDTNAALVGNFIQGLERRGEPNYLEDYSAPRI